MQYATVKIAADSSSLFYVNKTNCKKLLINPFKQNKLGTNTNWERCVIRCKNSIYEIKNDCRQFNKFCICSIDGSAEVTCSTSNCIFHNCTFINNQYILPDKKYVKKLYFKSA